MIHTININIDEIIEEHYGYEDRKRIMESIIYNHFSDSDRESFIKKLLEDLLETEIEFDNRHDVKDAINLISKMFGEI